jgi:hypothetical protein
MTARSIARPLAALAAAAIFVAACGSGTASTEPVATLGLATEAPVTDAPAATTGGEPTFALPSFDLPSDDEELEGLLPDEIAGETMQKFSLTGEAFMAEGNAEVQAVLDQFNKSASDLSVAFAGSPTAALIAYRLKGVDAGQFFDAFLAAAREDGEVAVTDASFGGKAVKKVVSESSDIGTVYVYTSGDVMFIVGGDTLSDAFLNEAFSKIG